MLLFGGRNTQRIDLSNRVVGTRSLTDLGFTCTNANPGWYFDGSLFRQAAANTFRFTSENGRTGLYVAESHTNEALNSSTPGSWNLSGATRTAATSIISGQTAGKITAGAAGHYIHQACDQFSGGDESLYAIVESDTGTTSDLAYYDNTGASEIARVRYTHSDGSVSVITGGGVISEYGSYTITNSGPNGNVVRYVYMYVDTSAVGGNDRVVRFYPSSGSAGISYIHHIQIQSGSPNCATEPIVTVAAPVTVDADVITSTSLPSWYSQSALTVLTRFERMWPSSVTGVFLTASDGTANNYFLSGLTGPTNVATASVVIGGGGSVNSISAVAMPEGLTHKAAYTQSNGSTYAAGDGDVGANGGQVGAPTITRLDIGCALGALYFIDARIFEITLRPIAMSSTELDYFTS